ncbi:MAG: polyamine aminopropyltransferase [Bdellovibrionales bacterium]
MHLLLLVSIFVISACGLVYQLIVSTMASYLLGDSITQFSTIIGTYLFAMGIGSYLSKFIHRGLVRAFVQVEILLGAFGGASSAILYFAFDRVDHFRLLMYFMVLIVGTLVGFEIPILMRILQERIKLADLVAKVFTFDYIGALLGSILFPLFLVPYLGVVKSGFLFGLLNVTVALVTLQFFGKHVGWTKSLRALGIAVFIVLTFGLIYGEKILKLAESRSYPDPVVLSKSSHYQRIVMTEGRGDLRLFLNSNLQFSSRDEYRYHEALVHVGLSGLENPARVLVLGGGDGLAVREILKDTRVHDVTLVDLDPEITTMFKTLPKLRELNHGSLNDSRVTVINADAFQWLKQQNDQWDFIIIDFPDPSNFSIGKLFSATFYRLVLAHLSEDGAAVVQSTSPYVAPKSFWCIHETLKSVGFTVAAYHALVPAFGEWGFNLASRAPLKAGAHLVAGLKFVTADSVASFFKFPLDMSPVPVAVNRLDNQMLVRYFEEEWAGYAH